MKYEIKDFKTEGEEKYIGFKVANDNGEILLIDKKVEISEGTTDEQYIASALELAEAEIDEWNDSFAHVGKEWNPDTNSFVVVEEAE